MKDNVFNQMRQRPSIQLPPYQGHKFTKLDHIYVCIKIILSVNRYSSIIIMIFNSNKGQLLESIRQRIQQIDAQCGLINHQIYQYSDERVADLTEKAQACEKQVEELEQQKGNKLSVLMKLKKDLEYFKGEGDDIQRQYRTKKQEKIKVQQSLRFLEEKHREEAPHLQTFLTQKGKSKENASKVRYAEDKLKNLSHKLKKEWEEAQYQYRLNNLIKQKLKQLTKNNDRSNDVKIQKGTAMSSVDASHETPNVPPFKQPKTTELSEYYNESISSTFRD